MLRSFTDEVAAACADAAEWGVADSALSDLSQKLTENKAGKSPPLVQAVYYLESEYLETFLLTPQSACAELPESHPLREALVALDSHARAAGTHDGYFWLLERFGAYSAPAQLDERALNRREATIFTTSVLNAAPAAK